MPCSSQLPLTAHEAALTSGIQFPGQYYRGGGDVAEEAFRPDQLTYGASSAIQESGFPSSGHVPEVISSSRRLPPYRLPDSDSVAEPVELSQPRYDGLSLYGNAIGSRPQLYAEPGQHFGSIGHESQAQQRSLRPHTGSQLLQQCAYGKNTTGPMGLSAFGSFQCINLFDGPGDFQSATLFFENHSTTPHSVSLDTLPGTSGPANAESLPLCLMDSQQVPALDRNAPSLPEPDTPFAIEMPVHPPQGQWFSRGEPIAPVMVTTLFLFDLDHAAFEAASPQEQDSMQYYDPNAAAKPSLSADLSMSPGSVVRENAVPFDRLAMQEASVSSHNLTSSSLSANHLHDTTVLVDGDRGRSPIRPTHRVRVKKLAKDAVIKAATRRRQNKAKFECEFGCGQTFTARHNQKYHHNSHKGLKEHPCSRCEARFNTPSDLKRHFKRCSLKV